MRPLSWLPLIWAIMVSPALAMDSVSIGELLPSSVDADEASAAANLAFRRLDARNAAIVCDISQERSVELSACFRRVFAQSGGKIAAETRCRAGERDFTGQIIRMKKAKPDIIYAPVDCIECALFVRQARECGLDVPVIAGSAAYVRELIDFGGKSVEGVICTAGNVEGITGKFRIWNGGYYQKPVVVCVVRNGQLVPFKD